MKQVLTVKGHLSIVALLASLVIIPGAGGISSLFTQGSFSAYQALQQPVFAPPGWIFAPIWPILYILMGIASYRIFMLGWKYQEVELDRLVGYFMVPYVLWVSFASILNFSIWIFNK